MNPRIPFPAALCGFTATSALRAADLPDPDGKPADMTKPVKVFILMGQSNMLGSGKIAGADKPGTLEHAVKTEKLHPFLVDDAGAWTQRMDIRHVRVMVGRGGGMGLHNNEWLTITGKAVGPEIGIGHHVGNVLDEPVMILKSCIGNRGLGRDLLPPWQRKLRAHLQGGEDLEIIHIEVLHFPAPPPRAFDQDPSHRFRRRAEEVGPVLE